MKTFLEYVAEDLLRKHGSDLSRVAVVFPNKRASLFLSEHLARLTDRPLWSPAYVTISELFRRHSALTVADPVKLVCDLHRCFTEQTGIDETLDHFYGWGQLLVADFDDLDKNMADADKVFANVRDIREMDDVSYLSEEQKQVIRRFFSNFSEDHNTKLKERFLRLWSHMSDIYHSFNQRLHTQQLAYEGALYREVAQRADLEFDYDHYAFVGFNMLQRVEVSLFKTLRQQGKASFYWDFDDYYMHGSEAGHYISQYLADFPNELDTRDAGLYRNFGRQKEVAFVSAPTENIQARYASTWLREHRRWADGRRTAIVLCDEKLLPAVIHALPDEVDKVNITTGYPLAESPVASLIGQLFALQTQGYSQQRERYRLRQVSAVLRHPYVAGLSPEVARLLQQLNEQKVYYPSRLQLSTDEATTLLFRPTPSNESLLAWLCDVLKAVAQSTRDTADPLMQEAVFRAYTLANRLLGLVGSGDLVVDVVTLQRLLGQLMQTTTIPFHGEPAEGVQVMGVLETRNLDFDHVLLLSCNEGNMPKGVGDSSFIPYNIRKAHGLTTIDHKVSIFSYYFHRLLQRATDVTLLYNNATNDGHTGEMSRFMLQLMVESPHSIRFQTLHAGQAFTPFVPPVKEKTAEVMQVLRKHFEAVPPAAGRSLSPLLTPSAINRYMRCPLQFYYVYVEGLREPDETDDDTIDNRIFGNIFHEASRLLYSRLLERSSVIQAGDLDALLRSKVDIERAVDQAMRTELFRIRDPHQPFTMELNGLQLINREVIIHYLRQLLEVDRRLAPFEIVGLEHDVVTTMQVGDWQTTIGGRIDRLDRVGERLRVVDYKTGSRRLRPLADVDAIFAQESLANHSDYYLQTFVYALIVRSQQPQPVSPALLFIQHASADDYDPTLCFGREPIVDVAPHQEHFARRLSDTVAEMFSPQLPFAPTDDRSRCQTCPYRLLCSVK